MRASIDHLKTRIAYDPETGAVTWLPRGNAQWDGKYAGKAAGRVAWNGYVLVCIEYMNYRVHHLAWAFSHGVWPTGDIDHIDGNRSRNPLSNLREASRSQNLANSFRKDKNTSGFKGVSWRRRSKPWVAHIKQKGKSRYLGSFDDPAEAHAAYCAAAEKMFGEFARTA